MAKKIHLNSFVPRDYQVPICKAFEADHYKKLLIVMPRRAGKDIVAWNLMMREAMRKVGVYFYCLPTFKQSRLVIWDSITNDGKKFLDYIPEELILKINSSEMKIYLINGSLIQLIGSDSYDTSLVGTNARLIVFSEFALSDPRAYQFARPLLNANDGSVIILSCVSPNTLVIAKDGLKRIRDISSSREQYSLLDEPIFGLNGFHNAEQFYYGGVQKTLKIRLGSGYELECTPIHPIWNGGKWIKAKDYVVGDKIPIQYGQNVWGKGLTINDFVYHGRNGYKQLFFDCNNEDHFYLLGLIHADGNYDKNNVCVTKKKDQEIINFLHDLGFRTGPDKIHHYYSSRKLCALLEFLGFNHGAKNKTFPKKLLRCSHQQLRAFLQGIFDGDGCSGSSLQSKGRIKLSSSCKLFVQDLQIVLLNFGIVSKITKEERPPQGRIKVSCKIYNLNIDGYFAYRFYLDIGFRLSRKQNNWIHVPEKVRKESGNVYPIDMSRLSRKLPKNIITNPSMISRRMLKRFSVSRPSPYFEELLSEKFFYSPITEITTSEQEVFDFVIPETHSFFSNGFISHNTPRSRNHFYDLYRIAEKSTDWFCYKLTLKETRHISEEAIEAEIEAGEMSRDLALQEYYCSFDRGQEGSIYSKYLDKLRLDGRITSVPWDSNHPVHTAWDIGVRDATSIIFFQVIGTSIHVIDCYENSSVGLEHYIKKLESYSYRWGKHIAPHDIQVREFGTGMSRIEKARQLGIEFTVSRNLSIEDGIEAVRSSLPKFYIDEKKCSHLVKALESYHYEFDSKRNVYSMKPVHDQYSHVVDALRYLCVSLNLLKDGSSPEELERRYREVRYGVSSNLPDIFNDNNRQYY